MNMRRYIAWVATLIVSVSSSALYAEPPADNLARARAVFEELLTITPNDPDLYRYLGDIAAAEGDNEKARQKYEEYVQRRPDDYYGYYRLGEMDWVDGKKMKAKKHFEEARLRTDRGPADLQKDVAEARMQALMGERARADELFGALIVKHPDDADLVNTYASTLIDTNRAEKAIDVARKFLAQHPDDYALQRTLVQALIAEREYDEAERVVDALNTNYPGDLGAQSDEAYLRYSTHDWYRAMPLYEELLRQHPARKDFDRTYDELYRTYRPYLVVGPQARFNGNDTSYGPYARYVHPINSQFTFETGYMFLINDTTIPGYDSDFSRNTSIVPLIAKYKPYRTVTVGGGIANQLNGWSYVPGGVLLADWDDPRVGRFHLDVFYNELFDDPVAGLYFDGRQDTVLLSYDRTFYDRFILNAWYSSIWYRIDGSKAAVDLGDDFGREDNVSAGVHVIVLKKPQLRFGYQFTYSKLHIDNNYLDIIPLIEEQKRSDIIAGWTQDWNDWITTDLGAFVGADPARDLSFTDVWGFNVGGRLKVSRNFEIAGHYEYSNESRTVATGHYQYFNVAFLYRF